MNIVDLISSSDQTAQWLANVSTPGKKLLVGLTGSAKTLAIVGLYREKQEQIIVVTPNLYYANNLIEDLANFIPENALHLFPINEVLSAEMAISSPEARAERVAALSFLCTETAGVVVVPVAGACKFLPAPTTWKQSMLQFSIGDEIELTAMTEQIVKMGYERQQMIGKPGEFSVRGSILDIYPLTSSYPVRIDLFDIEVDSIRYFEVDTQRSIEQIKTVSISPATDTIFSEDNFLAGSTQVQNALSKQLTVLKNAEDKKLLEAHIHYLVQEWDQEHPTLEDQYYLDFLYSEKFTIMDYLSKTGVVLFDDYSRMLESERAMAKEEAEWLTLKLAEHRVFPGQQLRVEFREVMKKIAQPITFFSLFQKGMGNIRFQEIYTYQCRGMQQFFGQMPLLKTETDRWRKQKQTTLIFVSSLERGQKIENIFQDFNISVIVSSPEHLLTGEIQIVEGMMQAGFEMPAEKIVAITEKEIFHSTTKKRIRKQTISNAERLKSYNELKPGDYVVHANHGIGKYLGMETLEIDGTHQDYMTILYQNEDKLFIPVTQLNLIQKYVASESKTPRINKLGGSEWTKTKRKVSARIEDIADELIQLYAKRESEKGFAFAPDDEYQREFEDAFSYSETDDQLRSVAEIKRDMERIRPMDRLLVGDVGFGKTEVALRAAFKAIRDDKQVAFLVPTTILAQQHYETMLDRFANFPVNIGILSRFSTGKQQKETAEKARKGNLDIVVGTHRILSKDVEFQNLGLLIVDEEQRFGVRHKERLKQLKDQVDVLTLTATPIPRTLNMSMLGVRDLSVIETPPANRYPIQTYVMEQNIEAIREAIQRELARDGQIFYLYNRVETIEQKVEELQFLVPEARIGYAHGQMSEIQLENVLYDFIEGQYDILVTTTIIETGVDIPNVNTLFVENADYMGLSQLYQLRGRVGRSNRVAYAYFMYQPQKILNEVSEKRLQAIKDFTELGSGFKIAMRDLSIRGAGNLLGSQQHGFIDAVGFDMYTQMLKEAVARKQGTTTPVEKRTTVEIELMIDAYLPTTYIQDQRQKIEIYKRIRLLETMEMYDELEEDLIDRFGEYPEEVAHLLTIGLIKMEGEAALLESIKRQGNFVTVMISKVGTSHYLVEQIIEALAATTLQATMELENEQMSIKFTLPEKKATVIWLQEITQFVKALREQKYKVKNRSQ